jgi:very-short-patch-repair endonuclease
VLEDGLPEPEVNGIIRDGGGYRVAECDLVFRKQRVLLEYEGDHHRADPATFRKDITRYDRLQDLGWRVIRVTEADLKRPEELLARIRRALARSSH